MFPIQMLFTVNRYFLYCHIWKMMANSGFIPGESFIRPIHPGNGYLQKYCGQRHPPEDPDRFPLGNRRKLALKFHKLCVDPVICGGIGIFDGVVQRVTTGFAAGKIREKSVVFFCPLWDWKTAGYINFIGKIPFCIITRSVVICSFRSSIYQFQNESKRVHDRMKDPGKNSSISGNVIIRKLSYIRKNDRYIRLFYPCRKENQMLYCVIQGTGLL